MLKILKLSKTFNIYKMKSLIKKNKINLKKNITYQIKTSDVFIVLLIYWKMLFELNSNMTDIYSTSIWEKLWKLRDK